MINTVDPLGGSYFVEEMTRRMVDGTFDYFRKIDDFGGMVEAIEAGFPQREIMDAAYRLPARGGEGREADRRRQRLPARKRGTPIETLYISDELADQQIAFINAGQGAAATRGAVGAYAGRPEARRRRHRRTPCR